MLLELHIKNFALIDKIDLEFSEGLNILTGETGAGKSILIDSINFLLGDKIGKDIIRNDSDFAYVEGVFQLNGSQLDGLLQELGIEKEDYLIISREVNRSGKNIARINGKTVTVNMLKNISRFLIDVHGQHEHQYLLEESTHIDILDEFCFDKIEDLKSSYKIIYGKLNEIEDQIKELKKNEQIKLQKMDILNFQINEISQAKLIVGEDDELVKKRNLLINAEKIYSSFANVYSKLYQNEDGVSAYDEIALSISHLESITKYDESILNLKNDLEEIYYKLEDVISRIRDYRDKTEFNQEDLNLIEERLDLINKLKRKYGKTIEDILEYYDNIVKEYEGIQKSEEVLEKLNNEYENFLKDLLELANKISESRKETAINLSQLIEEELKYLGMEKARFVVDVSDSGKLLPNGKDKVLFQFCANPGEQLKKLNKVASGGEMSRIMLAIKTVIAGIDDIPTLIFDEIDTGISGRTAQAVAEKMTIISSNHQVLCVTHLPQIASMADTHFKIKKMVKDNKTVTDVEKLDLNSQIDEIARMVGGALVTETTKNHAKEMLSIANELKKRIKTANF